MTDEQLRIRTASLDSRARMGEWQFEILQECLDGKLTRLEYLPDYPNDLNAMREAVNSLRSLPGSQYYDFNARLIDVCGSVGNAINADARTRAECYVKTMEAR
jgi:hypothetical protein